MAEEIFHDNLVDMEGPVQIIFREQLHWDANGNLTVDQEINSRRRLLTHARGTRPLGWTSVLTLEPPHQEGLAS